MTTKSAAPIQPSYRTVALSATEEQLARLAFERKGAAEQLAAQQFAETVNAIVVAHAIEPGAHVEFGAEHPNGPIVMRVTPPAVRPRKVPAPRSVQRGARGKRSR